MAAHRIFEQPGPQGRLDVLIVDDDEVALGTLRDEIRTLGHDCRVATNGVEALALHEEQRADVIVSDWRMPGMDGMELCRRVRAWDDGRTYTYLLFTSGHAGKRDFVAATIAGADGCLLKPIDLDDLEARLIAASRVVAAYRTLVDRNADLRHDSRIFYRAARVDPLTGVGNRLRLEEDLDRLQVHASRYPQRTSVAMCDLDEFKRYNDHHGHLAGDEALRRVAQTIQRTLRRADHVYRYGGEEYLVVLPEQGPAEAGAAMERVRAAVEALAIEHAPDARRRVLTISIGIASLSGEDRSIRDAMLRSDAAMYRAKARGGNAVSVDAQTGVHDPAGK